MTLARNQRSIEWPEDKVAHYGDRFVNAFLDNDWHSDIAFYIPKEDRLVPAHSLIVAAASPMLERICYESEDELSGRKVIAIPDIFNFAEFKIVLQYLYQGGEFELSFDDVDAEKIYLLAKYLELFGLMEFCIEHLTETLSPENVCSRFEHFQNIDHPFQKSCLDMMQMFTMLILANGSAMRMSEVALEKLLSMDRLNIECEADLLDPMLKWAENECIEQHLEPIACNLRKVLETKLGLIRFNTMKIEEFMEKVLKAKMDLLNDLEISTIVQNVAVGPGKLNKPLTIGSRSVSIIPRIFVKTSIKTKTYTQGHSGVGVQKITEKIEAPFPNKRTWLTGLEFCQSNPPPLSILCLPNLDIAYKSKEGDSGTIVFDQRLPLSHTTNGKWEILICTIDNQESLDLWHTIEDEDCCLVSSQETTCLKSVTFDYEANEDD